MSLVTRTPLALEVGHRDLTNRVSRGHVWSGQGLDRGAQDPSLPRPSGEGEKSG
jgi:hypothetical protein